MKKVSKVKLGIDNIENCAGLFQGKRVGLITNPTGLSSDFKSTIDILKEHTELKALYSPEHGIRGDIQAGEKVDNYIDEKSGVTVYSLYGKNKKPTYEILKDIDVLAFDIQDVGSRFYTFIYTMAYAMQSSREFGKTFVVFDRPNPIGGGDVEGNILEEEFKSFIGLYPITQRYGLTIGELAKMFNEEFKIGCDLKIIPMTGWKRNMYFEDTGLNWVMPSPNMPTINTAFVYNGTCLFEGTNISEGRGTTIPFEVVGAPWLDAYKLADKMNELGMPGVKFRPVYFTPTFSKHSGKLCRGVQLHVTDRKTFNSVNAGLSLLYVVKEMSGDKFEYIEPFSKNGKPIFDYNTGCSYVKEGKYSLDGLIGMWEVEARKFKDIKQKYHIY